ncbi:MAG: helix-turn-helix domain-containing protein [Bradyrhizobium sp.]
MREALESLIENYRYRVVRSVGSTADIRTPPKMGDGLKLVILGAQSTDDAITEAVRIRKLWPDSKIVLLFEHASIADFQKLLTSEIDGCVPLFASPETLVRTLDLVTIEGARVVVTSGMRRAAIQPTQQDEPCRPQVETYDSLSGNIGHETRSITVVPMHRGWATANSHSVSCLNGHTGDIQVAPTLRNRPRLSEREAQILNGLVQGHANKVIARACDITEATVKVHMKSILRKIQVANRTQAAVWALEHGHSVDQIKDAS